MTCSRFGFGIFLSHFFFLLNLTVCAPLNSAFDSEKDLPFCEQQQCDQENETNRWTDQSHAENLLEHQKTMLHGHYNYMLTL